MKSYLEASWNEFVILIYSVFGYFKIYLFIARLLHMIQNDLANKCKYTKIKWFKICHAHRITALFMF